VCGFNLGSNVFVQNLLTKTELKRPIAPPLLHFYIERMAGDKSFMEILRNTFQVEKNFGNNWRKFSGKWPWVGYQLLMEKEPWPLLVSSLFV